MIYYFNKETLELCSLNYGYYVSSNGTFTIGRILHIVDNFWLIVMNLIFRVTLICDQLQNS